MDLDNLTKKPKREYDRKSALPSLRVKCGDVFESRKNIRNRGLHPPTMAGIYGSRDSGAISIVISGGYEDDVDNGDEILYTGQGGFTTKGIQFSDQQLERGNAFLATSYEKQNAVQVFRGSHLNSKYAPEQGYRFDGFYYVAEYWQERKSTGFLVWRFRLIRIPGQTPLQCRDDFTPKAKKPKVLKTTPKETVHIPIEPRQKRQQSKPKKSTEEESVPVPGRKRKRSSYAERDWDPSLSLIPFKVDATPSQVCPVCSKKLASISKMAEHITNHKQSMLSSNNIDETMLTKRCLFNQIRLRDVLETLECNVDDLQLPERLWDPPGEAYLEQPDPLVNDTKPEDEPRGQLSDSDPFDSPEE
mmetsp:Transcript_10759/g.14763  ORF Transcript_10759/g.14763 Transcript_10759/m.14763 type:complete len:359 (-) Transcript_10759:3293-4369(-)